MTNSRVVGVLALQGAFREHVDMLKNLGAEPVEVRKVEHLEGIDSLVIPGGESTTMALIAQREGLLEPLRQWVHSGRPTFATCAGLILLANSVEGQKKGGQELIGGLDVHVHRNYWGAQNMSFEAEVEAPQVPGEGPSRAIFIRAPAVMSSGKAVEVLASVEGADGNTVAVAVSQSNILAISFHPELTRDSRWHRFFLEKTETCLPLPTVA